MSFQTTVLENGRWVTRSLDPYHVRAQNTQRQEEKTASQSTSPAKPPSLGLLTRTQVRSAVTTRIIPARIRHKAKNDVLFISADCVAIKEVLGSYTLKDVAIKNDFDSPIRSARILGHPRPPAENDENVFFHTDADLWKHKDPPAKINHEKQHLLGVHPGASYLPPHIAVLALQSNKLVFMCAVSGTSDQPQLLSGKLELPAARSYNEQLGEHVAVDPMSRAMAVAAHENSVHLYTLKSMELMSKEARKGSGLNPVKEERRMFAEGVILKMEFLHPPKNDPSQVVLLLIVSLMSKTKKGKTRMIWYEWNTNTTLREAPMQVNRHLLHEDEYLPLLLIPLLKSTAFMLICEKRVSLFKDVLTGTPSRYLQQLENVKDPEEPAHAGGPPIWTQWARPMRPEGHPYTEVGDAIYLCRDDGIVQYLEFHNNIDHILDSTHQAGRLGINVDTSFAILDVGPRTLDMIVASGTTSEGGLWRTWPRKDPKFLNPIPNWTPLDDLEVTNVPDERRVIAGALGEAGASFQSQQRMFACSGRGKHGAISELRYGFQASKFTDAIDLAEVVRGGVLGIWAFHGFFRNPEYPFDGEATPNDITYVLISHPTHTSLLAISLELDKNFVVVDVGLDKTVFAGLTATGLLVQICETSAVISSSPAPIPKDAAIKEESIDDVDIDNSNPSTQGLQTRFVLQISHSDSRILAACIHNHDGKTTLLAATQQQEQFYLQLGNIDDEYRPQGEPRLLPSQPSCLHLMMFGDDLLAFVATLDGLLLVFVVGGHGLVHAMVNPYNFAGSFAICDSIAVMASTEENPTQAVHLIVCGLRNGSICTLHCTRSGSLYSLIIHEELMIGNTSVVAITDATNKSRVILHCERSLCTLEYPKGSSFRGSAMVHSIWITDRAQPALRQGTLSAITQAVGTWLPGAVPGSAFGSFVCIDGDLLQFIRLEPATLPHIIPRRMQIGGSPDRVIYSSHLNRLIVLYNKWRVLRAETRNVRGRRALQSLITFLDPDTVTDFRSNPDAIDVEQDVHPDVNDDLLVSKRKELEQFLGITEWMPKVGSNAYHMLVVNTMVVARDSKLFGRLLFFNIVLASNGEAKLVMRTPIDLGSPAYSLAVYPDGRSIVYCCGSELCLQSLDPGEPGTSRFKLRAPIKAAMRSPCQCLTIKAPFIFVSTVRESLAVFKYEDDKLVYQYGDQSARIGKHHVSIPEHSLVLASDMTNTVIGLWQSPERRIDNTMTTLFEAVLPSSIIRLRHINRPVWYRDPTREQSDQAIIGSSEDGTITQFELLEKGWRLLRFIQNMAERDLTVCPFIGLRPHKRHIDPSSSKPHNRHINGDILQRVLERGPEALIRKMLDVEPDLESHTDFESVEARWERCRELAEEIVDVKDEDWLGRVVQWIGIRLRSAL